MERRIKTAVAAALCILLLLIPLSGVKESFSVQNVEKSAMVKSVGLDDSGKKATLSFVQSVIEDSSAQHAQGVVSAAAGNFPDAEKEAQILADKYLTFSYAAHFIIGLQTVESNMDACVRFLTASPVIQLSSYVYLCEGTAREMLQSISKDAISTDEVLTNLNLAGRQEGYYYPVTLLEIAKAQAEGRCVLIPVIGHKQEGINTSKKTVLVFKGYAVVEEGKLKALLTRAESRAYNILSGKMERSVVDCKTAQVLLLRTQVKTKPTFQNGVLAAVDFRIKTKARFCDVPPEFLRDEAFVQQCKNAQEAVLSGEMEALFARMKSEKTDILNLAQLAEIASSGNCRFAADNLPGLILGVRLKSDIAIT